MKNLNFTPKPNCLFMAQLTTKFSHLWLMLIIVSSISIKAHHPLTSAFKMPSGNNPLLENKKNDNETESKKRVSALMSNRAVRFIENKGQLTNTENKPVPFVLFKAETPGMNVYITEKGLTYVFSKTELQNAEDDFSGKAEVSEKQELKALQAAQNKYKTEMAWINVNLKNASIKRENIIKEGQSSEHFNFFYGL